MVRRFARWAVVGGIVVAFIMASCNLSVGPSGVTASLSLAGRTVSLSFGPGGLSVQVTPNVTTARTAVGFPALFEQTPAETPASGSMILRGTDVGVGRVLSAKEMVRAQGVPATGTATVDFYVAAGQSAALCDTATFMAEFVVAFTAGAGSIADEIYELSQAAIAQIAQNNVTICVEVTADFEGEITFYGFNLSFGGGTPNTALFTMYNNDSENIHILLPGETFDPANRLTPNTGREATLPAVQVGDYITVQAGRNGVVLDDVTCPIVEGSNYTATVEWDGVSVICSAEQVSTGGPPVAPTGEEIQVPIDSYGDAAEPTATYNGVDYAVLNVLDVNSSTVYPSNLPSNITQYFGEVNVDLAELGLAYVERMYFASHAAWVPDLPNGILIATLTCDYVEGGSPTTLEFRLGSTTAEWSYDRPDHDILMGGVSHSIIPILYSFPTVSEMGYDYEGHIYSGSLELDGSRTLSSITLELGSTDDFANNRTFADTPEPTWAGQGMLAITLVGPAGTPQAGGGGGGGGGTGTVTGQVVDAQTGAGLAGVLVEVEGTGLSVLTDTSGNFTISEVPAGGQTLQATLTGYVQTSVPAVVFAGATFETSIGMLAVGAGGDNVAAVLAWGETPYDLDLHMSGPDGSGGRFHAYFSDNAPFPHVFLDLDDMESFGPETMTVSPAGTGVFVAGDYHVWVHNFSGDPTFADATATVTVFAAGTQIAQYSVGSASGDDTKRVWQVVEFTVSEDGSISNVSVIQSFADGDSSTVF